MDKFISYQNIIGHLVFDVKLGENFEERLAIVWKDIKQILHPLSHIILWYQDIQSGLS